jgi:hypothetical protein
MIAGVARSLMAKLSALTPRERASLALLAACASVVLAVQAMNWASVSAQRAEVAERAAAARSASRTMFTNVAFRQRLASATATAWQSSRLAGDDAADNLAFELESMCARAGLNDPQVKLASEQRKYGHVSAITLTVDAGFDWASFLALLEEIENSSLGFTVRSVEVSGEPESQRIALVVAATLIDEEDAP